MGRARSGDQHSHGQHLVRCRVRRQRNLQLAQLGEYREYVVGPELGILTKRQADWVDSSWSSHGRCDNDLVNESEIWQLKG